MLTSARVLLCPKVALVDELTESVLLCRRTGEQDYDAHFSLVGGKLHEDDGSLAEGIRRELREELGDRVRGSIHLGCSVDVLFTKTSGDRMLLPHYYARFDGGQIDLNPAEYDEMRWVPVSALRATSPLIENVPAIVERLASLRACMPESEFVEI